ncbi:MAG: transglutaminase family protein [Kiloniellales bacterium]|nr:transglutaminase family protein [Kiloniellales bacterium]
MTRLTVQHTTVYRYHRPVGFGEHRLMFRPRDSHDMRLIDTALIINPISHVRWMHDVFSNSIAIARFDEPASELRFESRIEVEHYGHEDPKFPIAPYARTYPFSYSSEEAPDLVRTGERHYPDPEGKIDRWARHFMEGRSGIETNELLQRITRAISQDFDYRRRYAVGVQSPIDTLELGSGSCRDFALLMMEAVRALGFAARFVSGYLYDPAQEQRDAGLRGAGDTHAWVQVYLPGAGWVEFDPTNGLVGGANLIRVAVARDPSQALPLQGTFYGNPEDFIDMEVEVTVSAKP